MRRTASVTTLVNLETNYSPHKNKKQTKLRSEEHTSELQSQSNLVCRLLLEKKKTQARDSRAFSQPCPLGSRGLGLWAHGRRAERLSAPLSHRCCRLLDCSLFLYLFRCVSCS